MIHTNRLHLPDLFIQGFRGIDALSIPRLGRVTLLAGKNGIGKTTVLDAVRVYASRGRYGPLHDLLRDRDEMAVATNEEGDSVLVPDLRALSTAETSPKVLSLQSDRRRTKLNGSASDRLSPTMVLLLRSLVSFIDPSNTYSRTWLQG